MDSSHAAVQGAAITLLNRATAATGTLVTDEAGEFSTGGLPVGDYDVTARKEGFALAQMGASLIGGATATLSFQMSPAGEKTEITVSGTAGAVRSDVPQVGLTLGSFQIEEIPPSQ